MRVGAGTPGLGARTRRVVTAAGIAKSAVTRRGFLSTAKPACDCKSSCKSSGHGSDRVDTTEVWEPVPSNYALPVYAANSCGGVPIECYFAEFGRSLTRPTAGKLQDFR